MEELMAALALSDQLSGRDGFGVNQNLLDPLGLDPYDLGTTAAPSRSAMGLPPQPPANKSTGIKAGAEAAMMFADDLVSPAAKQAQLAAMKATGGIGAGGAAGVMGKLGRFAASPAALTAAKVGTGIGALGGVMGAADVLVGKDSAANKAMDATAMGIGGFLGAAGGPMGIAAGAGIGKALSDGTQFVLGGGKSAEQRRMEEALIAAQRGGLI